MSDIMKEVYTFRDVVLYSDKELDKTDGSRVWFKDGSEANLEDLSIKSMGSGQIMFDVLDREPSESDEHRTEVIRFEHGDQLDLSGCDLYFEIKESTDEHCWLELIGSDWFHATTQVETTDNGISVVTERRRRRWNHTEYIEGRMIIRVPNKPSLTIHNNGAGSGRINLPLDHFEMQTNGSLNIKSGAIDRVDVRINGSGRLDIREVKQSCNLRINGSGDIKVGQGSFEQVEASINGSGRIRVNATVQDAHLRMSGSGTIKVDRVIGSVHKHSHRKGSIIVRHLGPQKVSVD